MCPKGRDPFTEALIYRTIFLNVSVSPNYGTVVEILGDLRFTFNGESFYFPANISTWNANLCKVAFEKLRNVDEVICTANPVESTYTRSFTIQFVAFPVFPYENNIYTNDGNPPLSAFSCDTSGVVVYTSTTSTSLATSCVVADVVNSTSVPGQSGL